MESEQSRYNNFYKLFLLAKGLNIDLNSISSGLILIRAQNSFSRMPYAGHSMTMNRFRGARGAKYGGGVQFGVIRYSL